MAVVVPGGFDYGYGGYSGAAYPSYDAGAYTSGWGSGGGWNNNYGDWSGQQYTTNDWGYGGGDWGNYDQGYNNWGDGYGYGGGDYYGNDYGPRRDDWSPPRRPRETSPDRGDRRVSRLTEGNLRRHEEPRRRGRDDDVGSTGSRRSSVGSQWRGISTDSAHARYRRKNSGAASDDPSQVPKPTGKRMALLIAINPERSACATNSSKHMRNFLKRYHFTVEEVHYSGDPEQFEVDIEQGITELTTICDPGDSVFLHVIGYGVFEGQNCTQLLQRLVSGLPSGSKLTCVFDCCYLSSRPAFRIDPHIPKSKGRGKRVAQEMGPSQPVKPAVFCFMGEASDGDIAAFTSRDGQSCVFTSAWILACNNKDIKGYWNEPPSYAHLAWGTQFEVSRIVSSIRTPKGRPPLQVTPLATCSDRYDVDQPAWL
eukprot:TRINITY_DN86092_c0_g1_i1.p1 TRINITY_DN86092_c0_g1~~TRINITY_DN86092_c0_g1_i1.p1  ORF type:complete len:424 (+),score=36.83 TRINITY_DN86092_c0_g1_i1:35-1306(+)